MSALYHYHIASPGTLALRECVLRASTCHLFGRRTTRAAPLPMGRRLSTTQGLLYASLLAAIMQWLPRMSYSCTAEASSCLAATLGAPTLGVASLAHAGSRAGSFSPALPLRRPRPARTPVHTPSCPDVPVRPHAVRHATPLVDSTGCERVPSPRPAHASISCTYLAKQHLCISGPQTAS